MMAYAGEAELTIDWAGRALRLSPIDRLAYPLSPLIDTSMPAM